MGLHPKLCNTRSTIDMQEMVTTGGRDSREKAQESQEKQITDAAPVVAVMKPERHCG
jgi:hypothetical protein